MRADPAPRAIKAIMDEFTSAATARVALSVTPTDETVSLRLSLGAQTRQQPISFSMRAVPPKRNDDSGWVGLASGVLLYVGFGTGEEPLSAHVHFNPNLDLSSSAGTNAVATTTMLELLTQPLRVESPLVAGQADLDLRPLTGPEVIEGLRMLHEAYSARIEIEARTGANLLL